MLTCGEGHLVVGLKVAGPAGDDPAAEHDVLLAEQADGAEGAVKVMVVNVWGDAVLDVIHIDNGSVWLLVLGQNAPPGQAHPALTQLLGLHIGTASCAHADSLVWHVGTLDAQLRCQDKGKR